MVHGIPFRSSNLSVVDNNFLNEMSDVRGQNQKHNLTLDLHFDSSKSKKNKFHHNLQLSTPDCINLNQYEVDKLLRESAANDLKTATPTTITSLLLNNNKDILYNEDGSFPINSVLNNQNNESSQINIINGLLKGNSNNYINNDDLSMGEYDYENRYPTVINSYYEASPLPVKIKDEPQTVPSGLVSSPVSPVNMENQELMKADRKKARNRMAAAKCRKKKLERIACLESKVRELKDENSELGQKQATLKKEVTSLKERIVRHCQNGCSIMPMSSAIPFR